MLINITMAGKNQTLHNYLFSNSDSTCDQTVFLGLHALGFRDEKIKVQLTVNNTKGRSAFLIFIFFFINYLNFQMEESRLLFYCFLLSWNCRLSFKHSSATFFFFFSKISGYCFLSHEGKIPKEKNNPAGVPNLW